MTTLSEEFPAKLQYFADQLQLQPDPKAKQIALIAFLRELKDASNPTTVLLPWGGAESVAMLEFADGSTAESDDFLDVLEKNGLSPHDLGLAVVATEAEKPIVRLPCANVDLEKNWRCANEGRSACGECKLVSYCSKDCQRSHWRIHKKSCKDPVRSPLWQPAWIRENRDPTFSQTSSGWKIPIQERQFALGMHIWGNTPAVDTLNLPKNEGASASKSNHSLAYVASGDLRNVVRTVNELPVDYSGELTILLNDREPTIVVRNMILLMILGTIEDNAVAADVALHFWSSAFVQMSHAAFHAMVITQLTNEVQQNNPFSLKLGQKSVMTGTVTEGTIYLLVRMLLSKLQLGDARAEMQCIRFEPTRQDRHDRGYARLNASHRLASLEYRRIGIVLPFGAATNNFNTPNKFLFSPEGRWLENDLATPLGSWNIEDVIKAGKEHGVQPADLYGCLYFYLSEQLLSFAERIKKFRISFRIFDQDARDLATKLRLGVYETQSLPKDISFDRIDVSNIIDAEYVGISNILEDWTPFLSKTNRYATIVGYSMNWVPKQRNSEPTSQAAIGQLVRKLMVMGKVSRDYDPALFSVLWKSLIALYDNSTAFNEYLKAQGTNEAARKAGAKLKAKHSIVPHRIGAPLEGLGNALPQFPTEDSWYWNVQVGSSLLSERFVEFSRI